MEKKFALLPALFTFLVFILMVFKLRMRSKMKDSSKNLPPGPWKLPLIGHLHLFITSLPHYRLRDLAKKHGPLMHLKLGEVSHIIVSSPEVAQQVMKTHDINFANRPSLLAARIIMYNCTDIAFAPYGSYWRQLRKICTLELLSAKRVQSFRLIREEQVSNLVTLISSNNAGLPINLGEMLYNLSYSITSRTAFSGRGNKQLEEVRFNSVMKILLEEAAGFSVADLYPSIKLLYVVSGMKRKLERLHQDFNEMIERIIEEHKANKAKLQKGDNEIDDLVDVLLNLQEQGDIEFHLTTDNIKAVILFSSKKTIVPISYLFAGHVCSWNETSATVIEWAMSEMMKNPRVMEKAQAEVRQVFDRTGHVNESNIHELNYLKMVIKETLRLHPPGPLLLPRENVERCEMNGYEIPAKSRVLINIWAMGRDPNYWNEAERFNPERFLESSIDFRGASFEYIPFGGEGGCVPACHMLPVSNSLKLFASTPKYQQQFAPLLKHKRFVSFFKCRPGATVCKLGGEDKSADNSQGSPWKAIEKAIGNFGKQQSIEDVLRQQMEKEEYYDEGSGKPPGGGGGNGGSGDGSGGSEDEGFSGILDETLQVILATIGFILLYVYIISGEELGRLTKDYIKFLFGGKKSVRLKRAMKKWRRFLENLKEKKEDDELWLEKAIITTPTWYDSPDKYKRLLGTPVESDDAGTDDEYGDDDADNNNNADNDADADNDGGDDEYDDYD
ncbi:Cytochrome P450 [Corchorus capsularis]|uniref:Cytochrome P450 n=1 Tax=Corchorus capsularis TaxID=210143 RepID=A0A1R3FUV2_COCAP|nr:Cytochrome P450 [Corchorus capsularis]